MDKPIGTGLQKPSDKTHSGLDLDKLESQPNGGKEVPACFTPMSKSEIEAEYDRVMRDDKKALDLRYSERSKIASKGDPDDQLEPSDIYQLEVDRQMLQVGYHPMVRATEKDKHELEYADHYGDGDDIELARQRVLGRCYARKMKAKDSVAKHLKQAIQVAMEEKIGFCELVELLVFEAECKRKKLEPIGRLESYLLLADQQNEEFSPDDTKKQWRMSLAETASDLGVNGSRLKGVLADARKRAKRLGPKGLYFKIAYKSICAHNAIVQLQNRLVSEKFDP